jgi:peptidoglycan/LPS O-acetylase OafA/YrhL
MLLVFPLWLIGVVTYGRTKRQLPSYLSARLIWIFSILLIAIVMLFRRSPAQGLSFLPPEFSPSDYILAAMVAVNIWAASYLQFTWLKRFKAPIAAVASTTFSLYLMHAPLMKLVAGFVPVWWPVWIRGIIIGASTFAVILPLAHVTEKKKGALREIFSRAFLLLNPARP